MSFQGESGAPPDLGISLVVAKRVGPQALVTAIPGPLKPTLEILRPRMRGLRLRRGYIGYMVHWNGIAKDPSQPVGPHKGGQRFVLRFSVDELHSSPAEWHSSVK